MAVINFNYFCIEEFICPHSGRDALTYMLVSDGLLSLHFFVASSSAYAAVWMCDGAPKVCDEG